MENKAGEMTEKEIRQIAREESLLVFEKSIKGLQSEVELVKKLSQQNAKTLGKIERLLLGEFGEDSEYTLKSQASFAYKHAKQVENSGVLQECRPALDWFKDMNTPDKGCEESGLDILGKMISSYNARKWWSNFFGIINIATLIGLILLLINLFNVF